MLREKLIVRRLTYAQSIDFYALGADLGGVIKDSNPTAADELCASAQANGYLKISNASAASSNKPLLNLSIGWTWDELTESYSHWGITKLEFGVSD